jgi:hypothetical protein
MQYIEIYVQNYKFKIKKIMKGVITFLEETVNNNNLPFFGVMTVYIPAGNVGTEKVTFAGDRNMYLNIVGHSDWQNYISENYIPGDGEVHQVGILSASSFQIEVVDQFEMTTFDNAASGSRTQKTTTLEPFSYRENMKKIVMAYQNDCISPIKTLAPCLLLERVDFISCNNITGNIEDLAAMQVELGRTSGVFYVRAKNVKYQNAAMNNSALNIRYGTSMIDPTSDDLANGYQISQA